MSRDHSDHKEKWDSEGSRDPVAAQDQLDCRVFQVLKETWDLRVTRELSVLQEAKVSPEHQDQWVHPDLQGLLDP